MTYPLKFFSLKTVYHISFSPQSSWVCVPFLPLFALPPEVFHFISLSTEWGTIPNSFLSFTFEDMCTGPSFVQEALLLITVEKNEVIKIIKYKMSLL